MMIRHLPRALASVTVATTCFLSIQVWASDSAGATAAPQPSDFVVIGAKIHAERHAKNVFDTVVDCTRSDACKETIDSLADFAGVDISLVTTGIAVLAENPKGEMTFFDIRLPNGYVYCHSAMYGDGVNPPGTKTSPFLQAFARNDEVHVQTWTKKNNIGGAGTSISATFAITGVRAEKADFYRQSKQCKTPDPKKMIVNCRGNFQVAEHKDQPPCTDFKD